MAVKGEALISVSLIDIMNRRKLSVLLNLVRSVLSRSLPSVALIWISSLISSQMSYYHW